jgi:hypothetical protein
MSLSKGERDSRHHNNLSLARNMVRAKKIAETGPVIVTDPSAPVYRSLKTEDYRKLARTKPTSLLEAMDAVSGGNVEFDPPVFTRDGLKPFDMSRRLGIGMH